MSGKERADSITGTIRGALLRSLLQLVLLTALPQELGMAMDMDIDMPVPATTTVSWDSRPV